MLFFFSNYVIFFYKLLFFYYLKKRIIFFSRIMEAIRHAAARGIQSIIENSLLLLLIRVQIFRRKMFFFSNYVIFFCRNMEAIRHAAARGIQSVVGEAKDVQDVHDPIKMHTSPLSLHPLRTSPTGE